MRPIRTAEILAVGSELTTGSTRDTNSGELAGELTALGVRVLRSTALPDDLELVRAAIAGALSAADLIVTSGGLGPTPDDLTREAIAAACGLEPRVDEKIERWLEALFERRGLPMPETNRKQAWLIDGAQALPNAHGSAPGWWVERPDGQVIVALPGPPREMRPMWHEHALPLLRSRELGADRVSHTLRVAGIGESALVPLIGEDVLRAANPQVATYARADAVDVVVSAVAEGGRSAAEIGGPMLESLRVRLAELVFAEGQQGWPEALAARLGRRTLALVESGTGGQVGALLGASAFLVQARLTRHLGDADEAAAQARTDNGADVGLAVHAAEHHSDMRVTISMITADRSSTVERTAFLAGEEGRRRVALTASAALWQFLGER